MVLLLGDMTLIFLFTNVATYRSLLVVTPSLLGMRFLGRMRTSLDEVFGW